jgi:hypothetical protein
MLDRYTTLRDKLPPSYLEFIESHDGGKGELGDELGYFVIWSRDSIQENWDGDLVVRVLNLPFRSVLGIEVQRHLKKSAGRRFAQAVGFGVKRSRPSYA